MFKYLAFADGESYMKHPCQMKSREIIKNCNITWWNCCGHPYFDSSLCKFSPKKANQPIVSITEKWFRCFHFYLGVQYIFKANFLIAIYQFLFPPITSSVIWNYSQTLCFENGCFLARMLKFFFKIILCRHSSENFIEILDMRLFYN